MVDLKTNYLGLELKNPIVASASPLSEKISTVIELEQAGVSAVVMYSLFEEQIIQESLEFDRIIDLGIESYAEALSYFPEVGRYSTGPETYLDHLSALKRSVDIPVIASLNGTTKGRWIEYAEKIQAAGADAIELNLYNIPTDPDQTSVSLENDYEELAQNICMAIEIPVAIKLSPFFTSLPNMIKKFTEAGVKGAVLFNRFYQPDFDLSELEVIPNLELSRNRELRKPLRWIAILYGKLDIDFALTTGVHTGEDVIKAMMAGAKVAMIASEFLKKGPKRGSEIIEEVALWMETNEYESITQMQGSMSQKHVSDPTALERANYMKVLSSYK